jgi:hypothetical protein
MATPFKMKGMDFGNSPVRKEVDLTKTPNPTTKAIPNSNVPDDWSDDEFENKGDFNISNLHKDTKISLDKKKKANKNRSRKANEQERIEDAKGL